MTGMILEAEPYETYSDRKVIRMRVEIDNDIAYAFVAFEFPFGLENLFEHCHIPLVRTKDRDWVKLNLNALKNKLVPMVQDKYRDKLYWALDFRSMKYGNESRRSERTSESNGNSI